MATRFDIQNKSFCTSRKRLNVKSRLFCNLGTKQTEQPLGWAAASALRRLLAYLQAPVHRLTNLMTPWQQIERFFAKVCQFSSIWCAPLLLDGITSDIYFAVVALSRRSEPLGWARTAAGEVRQASCSKRLRKLRLKGLLHLLCFPRANFPTDYFIWFKIDRCGRITAVT